MDKNKQEIGDANKGRLAFGIFLFIVFIISVNWEDDGSYLPLVLSVGVIGVLMLWAFIEALVFLAKKKIKV